MLLLLMVVLPSPSIQHFIPPLDSCTLAKICNHTGDRECGLQNSDAICI